MKLIVWIVRLIVFVVLLCLALANTGAVTLRLFLGYAWTAPLIMIGLAFFVVGGIMGLLATLPSLMRQRLELYRMRRDLVRAQADPEVNDQPSMPPPLL